MTPHGGFIDKEQFPLIGPVLKQHVQIDYKGRLFLGIGSQMAVTQASLTNSKFAQQLAYPLATVLDPAVGKEKVLEQLGGPKTHRVADLAWALPQHLLERGTIDRVPLRRTARNRRTLQALKFLVIERVYAEANGVFIAVQVLMSGQVWPSARSNTA